MLISFFPPCHVTTVSKQYPYHHFYRASYASAVLGVIILSVRHTRAL